MSASSRPGTRDLALDEALRESARGVYPLEAGVELLIAHAAWLQRDDFLDAFLDAFLHTDTSIIDGSKLASIDWNRAITALDTSTLPCSSGEQRMLRLAASIADGTPVSLRDTLTGLDHRNTRLVITAVLHASGQRPSAANP
jgi:hypothetical protein